MSLNSVTYTDKTTVITAENLNDIQTEIVRLDEDKFDKSGGILSGSVKMDTVSKGYYLVDETGAAYPGIYNNGSNLWIGSRNSDEASHVGKTFISTGYKSDESCGYKSFQVAVPNDDNTGSSTYSVWHDGYINYDKLYPVGSCYTTSTNTNPDTIFPGTTWTLFDKHFTPTTVNNTNIFTINTTNTSSLTSAYVERCGNYIYLRIAVVNKVAYSGDSSITVGTVNYSALGITRSTMTAYRTDAYCDAANAIPIFSLGNGNNDTGTGNLVIQDVIGKSPSTSTGLTFYFNIDIVVPYNYMEDSYCNQFMWRRTA